MHHSYRTPRCFLMACALAGVLFAGCDSSDTLDACTVGEVGLASAAEAAIFDAVQEQGGCVTEADVAFFITREALGEIGEGRVSADAAADLLVALVETEAGYLLGDRAGGQAREAVQQVRADAYATFRQALSGGQAPEEARRAFEAAYATAYVMAGEEALEQAFASRALVRAAGRFGTALGTTRIAMERQARLAAAHATRLALREAFEAGNASPQNIAWIESAATTWLDTLETADSVYDFDRADLEYSSFPGGVHSPLVFASGVSSPQVTAAEAATLGDRSALSDAIEAASTARAVADAVRTYYADARQSIIGIIGDVPMAVDGVLLSSAPATARDGS